MKWTEQYIHYIVSDLAEENAFACRALFKIAKISFTDKVPTLAVSLSSQPVLYINLDFLEKNVLSEDHVKAVLMHEFLHVILQHTEKFEVNNPLLNIALDAIINSIIHRTYGEKFSGFFKGFYKSEGIESLLRPYDRTAEPVVEWNEIHQRIYDAGFAADDLYELLQYLHSKGKKRATIFFIGNHGALGKNISQKNKDLLDEILSKMNGTGIWNKPDARGANGPKEKTTVNLEKHKLAAWSKDTYALLKKCLQPDKEKTALVQQKSIIPILSAGDRKSFASLNINPFIPFAAHHYQIPRQMESVSIYLDVSGSMAEELNRLVALFGHFRDLIKTPVWVFSDSVEKANFKNGKLEYETSYGTSIRCVFDHMRTNKTGKCLIVTDGYTETITVDMLVGINTEHIRVLISANGNANQFRTNHIKYHQLKPI